jgi:hypothetical protein
MVGIMCMSGLLRLDLQLVWTFILLRAASISNAPPRAHTMLNKEYDPACYRLTSLHRHPGQTPILSGHLV